MAAVAQRHKFVTVNVTGCGCDPHIFSFSCSGVEAKRCVELRQYTRNAS